MDFYKFWRVLEEANDWNMRPENRADFKHHYGSPEDEAPDNSIQGTEETDLKLVYSDGTFKDKDTGKAVNIPLDARSRSIIGEPGDTYSLEAIITVSGSYVRTRGGDWDVNVDWDGFNVHGCKLHNERTGQHFEVPNPQSLFCLYDYQNTKNAPYEIIWEDERDRLSVKVRAAR